jgi:GNAT superfamily N-acetyltransferase
MNPAIRLAVADNLDRVTELRREYCAADGVVFDPARNRAVLERLFADASLGRLWLIAPRDDANPASRTEAVGYLCVCVGFSLEFGRDAFLDELYVREAWRGRGFGRAALEFAIAACPALGVQTLHLLVAPGNARARDIYDRRGFSVQNRHMLSLGIEGRA